MIRKCQPGDSRRSLGPRVSTDTEGGWKSIFLGAHTLPDDTKIEASWILPGGIGAGTAPEIAIVWWYTETVTATMIGNCGISQVTAHALDPTNIVARGLVSVSDSSAVREIAGPPGFKEELSA